MKVDDIVIACTAFRLAGVVARCLQLAQVLVTDISRDVVACKHRGVELPDLGIALGNGPHQVVQVLVDQPVSTNGLAYLCLLYTSDAADE